MELKQIMKLVDAGFTKEEIMSMETSAEAQAEIQEDAKNEAPAKVKEKEETKEPENTGSKIDEAIAKLDKLTDKMAKVAIMNTQQPERASVDDFLASIIDPTYKGGKE